jgi:uncharacterized protein
MANRFIFVDTSAWYALVDKNDRDHVSAVNSGRNLNRPLVTSNYVFDETLTLIKIKLGPRIAIDFGQKLWDQDLAILIRVSEKDEDKAWKLFSQYDDKGFSFTDCTSFVLMERMKINTAFAYDEHLTQYGNFLTI